MRKANIQLIGAGSLGSYTALSLVKRGFEELSVWDDDVVEYHNRRNQMYREEDIGRPKVEALAELIRHLAGIEITVHNEKAAKDTEFRGIVIIMVDSMKVRKEIFEAVKYNPRVQLFVDGRSGGHEALVYAVNPIDSDAINQYEKHLYSDEEAVDAPCSDQTTLSTVETVAAVAASLVQLWSYGEFMPICTEVRISYNILPSVDSENFSL